MARTTLATAAPAELAARLRLAVTRLSRRLRQEAQGGGGGGISPSQLSALSSIERLGPLTLGELSAVERVQPPTMTRVVAALEEAKLVRREVDPADRRVARVRVTPGGQRFVIRTRTRKDAYLAARLRRLDPSDVAALEHAAAVLEKLLEEGP